MMMLVSIRGIEIGAVEEQISARRCGRLPAGCCAVGAVRSSLLFVVCVKRQMQLDWNCHRELLELEDVLLLLDAILFLVPWARPGAVIGWGRKLLTLLRGTSAGAAVASAL